MTQQQPSPLLACLFLGDYLAQLLWVKLRQELVRCRSLKLRKELVRLRRREAPETHQITRDRTCACEVSP